MADWVHLGTDVMIDARGGISRETIARQLHVSSKTYERWEKRGEVPRHHVVAVAKALGLEIEQPARASILVAPATDDLMAKVDRIEGLLEELLRQRGDGSGR